MPSINVTQTWLHDVTFTLENVINTTVWLIGYIRPPQNTTFTFQLKTNINSTLFLSTDENPNNIVQIANTSSPRSSPWVLQKDTKYVNKDSCPLVSLFSVTYLVTICCVLVQSREAIFLCQWKQKCTKLQYLLEIMKVLLQCKELRLNL